MNNNQLVCSIGVICYNEEANIGKLLKALLEQKLQDVQIAEIIVVSSACSDKTDDIVSEYARANSIITLISQAERKGKSSAINLFLQRANSEILIIESGDTIPDHEAIERIVLSFKDRRIGAVGGRPMPVNSQATFMGYAVHLLWRLHHRMAMIQPKLGELIAFRKIMSHIPEQSAVDEASIEALMRLKGLRLKYVPQALIYNKGPETLKDHLKQRRRIQNGHLWLKKNADYKVASQDSSLLLKVVIEELIASPGQLPKLLAVILIEAYARMLGSIDFYVLGKNPFAWDISESTKNLG
ncbi:MAG: glycosyltransferase [Candidatus Cloacimonetes bacterium]|nr:glycosyltransferase [Candidatus Cloacimonadota bacterium]